MSCLISEKVYSVYLSVLFSILASKKLYFVNRYILLARDVLSNLSIRIYYDNFFRYVISLIERILVSF